MKQLLKNLSVEGAADSGGSVNVREYNLVTFHSPVL